MGTFQRYTANAFCIFPAQEEAAAACMTAVGRHVRQHLKSTMQATFSCSILDPALAYVDAVPLPFLQMTQLTGVRVVQHKLLYYNVPSTS